MSVSQCGITASTSLDVISLPLIPIFIQMRSKKICFAVDPATSIHEVKKRLLNITGIPIHEQQLFCHFSEIKSSRWYTVTLTSCNITAGATVHLI